MESAAATIVEFVNDGDAAGLLDVIAEASLSKSIGVNGGPASDSPDALLRSLGFLNAVDASWVIAECEPTGSSGRLACVVPAAVPLLQAFDLPEVDSDLMLQVADDGTVTRFSWVYPPVAGNDFLTYWTEGIQPFCDWMEQTHSEDLDAMLTDTHGMPQSDDVALELWATHTSDYLASMEI